MEEVDKHKDHILIRCSCGKILSACYECEQGQDMSNALVKERGCGECPGVLVRTIRGNKLFG